MKCRYRQDLQQEEDLTQQCLMLLPRLQACRHLLHNQEHEMQLTARHSKLYTRQADALLLPEREEMILIQEQGKNTGNEE